MSTPQAAHAARNFAVVSLALACTPRHDLARSLRAHGVEQGALQVNAHPETTVCGLYMAGEVVR
jgi:thioredoxin reductase